MGLYAAYGSNMDPAQMIERCPSSPFAGTGWVRGRLTFGVEKLGWEGALATLVPVEDDGSGGETVGVFVALYDLTEADQRALVGWEGADHGLYRKVRLGVHTLAGDVVAYAYALDAFEGGLPAARPPGRDRRRGRGRRGARRLPDRPARPRLPVSRELRP